MVLDITNVLVDIIGRSHGFYLCLTIDASCHACLLLPTIDCWKRDSHDRPSFSQILKRLSNVTPEFLTTPPETFQSIRMNWKEEVQRKFIEFKDKELVR